MMLKEGLVKALLDKERRKWRSESKCMPSERHERADHASALSSCRFSGFSKIDIPAPNALRQVLT